MPGPKPIEIKLSDRLKSILEKLSHSYKNPKCFVERSNIILKANEGKSNSAISRELDIDRYTVRTWRERWADMMPTFLTIEDELSKMSDKEEKEKKIVEKELYDFIERTLSDLPRGGAPCIFSSEQVVKIISVACEPPIDSGIPMSHWTSTELSKEVMKRGIVEKISPTSVWRLLKKM